LIAQNALTLVKDNVEQDRVSAATMEAANPTIKHCSDEVAQLQKILQDADDKKKAQASAKLWTVCA
jgi:hypothetical protein